MAIFQDKDKNGRILKTKDGRSWYFKVYKKDFQGNNKAYKSRRYLTKKETEEAERLFLMNRDNPIKKEFGLVSNDYFNNLKKTRKESTYYSYKKDYEKHIYDFFKKKYINEITVNDIKNWHEYLEKKKISIGFMNKIYNILKCIFDYAMKNYGIISNPVQIVGRFQDKNDKVTTDENRIKYISYENFEKFIAVIDDIMWKTFFIFLYYTGMRRGEVQALNWNDIDFDNSQIIVNKSLSVKTNEQVYIITNTKTKTNRKIKMSKTLEDTLKNYKNYLQKYADFNNNWFVFGNSRFLPQTTIDRYKHKYFEKLNKNSKSKVQEIKIHEFRHSHVSLLINEYVKTSKEKNMKIDMAKFFLMMSDRMGHTVEVMQKTYMHLFPTIQDEIVDLLNNL